MKLKNKNNQAGPGEKQLKKIIRTFHIELPATTLPYSLKIIILFTLIGGLSIIGSAFADVFNPTAVKITAYFLRLIAGLAAVVIAYGLTKKQRWALWLYGFLVVLGLLINPVFAILPVVILIYLISVHNFFQPSIFDFWAQKLWQKIVLLSKKISNRKSNLVNENNKKI